MAVAAPAEDGPDSCTGQRTAGGGASQRLGKRLLFKPRLTGTAWRAALAATVEDDGPDSCPLSCTGEQLWAAGPASSCCRCAQRVPDGPGTASHWRSALSESAHGLPTWLGEDPEQPEARATAATSRQKAGPPRIRAAAQREGPGAGVPLQRLCRHHQASLSDRLCRHPVASQSDRTNAFKALPPPAARRHQASLSDSLREIATLSRISPTVEQACPPVPGCITIYLRAIGPRRRADSDRDRTRASVTAGL